MLYLKLYYEPLGIEQHPKSSFRWIGIHWREFARSRNACSTLIFSECTKNLCFP